MGARGFQGLGPLHVRQQYVMGMNRRDRGREGARPLTGCKRRAGTSAARDGTSAAGDGTSAAGDGNGRQPGNRFKRHSNAKGWQPQLRTQSALQTGIGGLDKTKHLFTPINLFLPAKPTQHAPRRLLRVCQQGFPFTPMLVAMGGQSGRPPNLAIAWQQLAAVFNTAT